MESHVIPRLHFNPPPIALLFGSTRHEPKRRAESPDRKRLHHYAPKIDCPQLRHSVFKKPEGPLPVQLRTRTEIVNPCFNEFPLRVEDINRNELPPNLIARSRHKRRGNENLQAILDSANTAGIVVIVVNGNQNWRLGGH